MSIGMITSATRRIQLTSSKNRRKNQASAVIAASFAKSPAMSAPCQSRSAALPPAATPDRQQVAGPTQWQAEPDESEGRGYQDDCDERDVPPQRELGQTLREHVVHGEVCEER